MLGHTVKPEVFRYVASHAFKTDKLKKNLANYKRNCYQINVDHILRIMKMKYFCFLKVTIMDKIAISIF